MENMLYRNPSSAILVFPTLTLMSDKVPTYDKIPLKCNISAFK